MLGFHLNEFVSSGLNIFYEFRNSKKAEAIYKCKVEIHFPNGTGSTYWGLVDEGHQLLFVPEINGVWMYPFIRYVDGIRKAYVSSKYHRVINLEDLINIADAQKYNALVSFRYLRQWVTIKIKNARGTIDFSVFDNDISADLVHDAFKLMRTKVLEFLNEVPKRIFILSCVLCGFIGGFLGSLATIIVVILFLVFT